MRNCIILLGIIYLSISCGRLDDSLGSDNTEQVEFRESRSKAELQLLWHTDINRGLVGFSKPKILDDLVIIGSQHNLVGKAAEISGYDIQNGSQLWSVDQLEPHHILNPFDIPWIVGDNFFTFYSGNMTVLDYYSGTKIFDEDLSKADAGNARYSMGSFYYGISDRIDPLEEETNTAILRINPYNFDIDTIITSRSRGTDWRESLDHPFTFRSNSGDTLLAYARKNYTASPRTILHQMEVWNMTKNRMEWTFKTDEVVETGSFARHPPQILGKNLYVSAGAGGLFCFDKNTGDMIWHHDPVGGIGLGGYYLHQDLVIILTEGAPATRIAFNRYTGEQIWKENTRGTASLMEELDGIIYYTAGKELRGVNIISGEEVLTLQAPFYEDNNQLFFEEGIAIDKRRRLLVATDYKHVLCYKIPNSLTAYKRPEEALREMDD